MTAALLPASPLRSGGTEGVTPRQQAESIVAAWSRGEPPDTRAALSRFPQLRLQKSVVLDLAYEEFCLRYERGEKIDVDVFCASYPEQRATLRRLIIAHLHAGEDTTVLQQEPDFSWPAEDATFEGYQIRRRLGRGAYGRVYLAWDDATHTQVVLKVFIGDTREARMMANLEHPAIVPVKHARTLPNGVSYLVMPFLGCATLHDLIDSAFAAGAATSARAILDANSRVACGEDEVSIPSAVAPVLQRGSYVEGIGHLLGQLARGLAFLHLRGIRHRDLKPSNVLLTWAGQPVILDFNLAQNSSEDLSRCGGTLGYMAPEQLQSALVGSGTACTERADMFAFGAIAYELLTGKHPYGSPPAPLDSRPLSSREVALWLLGRHREGVASVGHSVPDVDPILADVIDRCLAFDPGHRLDASVAADRIDQIGRWPQRIRRHRRLAAVAVAIVGIGLLSGAAFAIGRPPYQERLFARALAARQMGDFQQAEDLCDELIKADRTRAGYFFTRGLARMRLEHMADAAADFRAAFELEKSAKTAELLAYCCAYHRDNYGAIGYSNEAERLGCGTAALYNNRAASLMRVLGTDPNKNQMREQARFDLTRALQADPNLVAARYNVARLEFSDWQRSKMPEVLERAKCEIDQVLAAQPASPAVYVLALEIYSCLPDSTPVKAERLREFLSAAHERGQDVRLLKALPPLNPYLSRPDFQELLARTPARVASRQPAGLVEPSPE